MRVYIAQLKCPSNHCVVATAGEFDSDEKAKALALILGSLFDRAVQEGKLNHECGICKAADLHVEVGATRFRTMEEAAPFLRASQKAQMASRELLRRSRN